MFGLLDSPSEALRMAGADVLAEMVAKRMEPVAKLALVQQLRVAPVCARWRDALPGASTIGYKVQGGESVSSRCSTDRVARSHGPTFA